MSSKNKNKNKILKENITFFVLTFIGSLALLFVPINNISRGLSNPINDDAKAEEGAHFVINEIPDNMELVSKFVIDNIYTNILLKNKDSNELYESHIYSNDDGLEVAIDDLIKKDKIDVFWNKIYELLALKYPAFIVNGIKSSVGIKAYDIKENEMIIYFMNYTIEPQVDELISLKINYNEIKDYINFNCKLDKSYANESGYNYISEKKTVALTYDDGPSGDKTKQILKILDDNKARATFFMVGNKMQKDKKTVLKVFESGNEIGSHTYAHGNLKRQSADERIEALTKTDAIYEEITGSKINLLRPPYGDYKKDMLKELNYSVILWNIDTEDWRYDGVDRIVDEVLDNLSDGSIILMHDSYNRTVEATAKLLPILYVKGYQVTSVSELAKLKGVDLQKNNAYRKF